MLETTIETKVVAEARRLGVPQLKLAPPGSTGWPDRLFFVPGGRPLLIEFKRPGAKPRRKQVYTHDLLRRLGYDVQVHDNARTAIRALTRAVEAGRVPEEEREVPPRARRGRSLP